MSTFEAHLAEAYVPKQNGGDDDNSPEARTRVASVNLFHSSLNLMQAMVKVE